ncbi:MAG: cyclodeaminase/cyclohydrolase family protein [Oscillospiraceae bacterium]|nr:cyclodeaminase/cyclohydrolase family protein [Oscillospiraceae bacterium]
MADKLNVSELKTVLFAGKSVNNFNKDLSEADNKLGIGSAAAEAAATAAALALLAVNKTNSKDEAMKNAAGNLETLRTYFLHLIDEENKAKLPLEKRLEANAPENEIEGGYRTACTIVGEIIYSVISTVEVLDKVADSLCPCTAAIASSALFFARTAMETCRVQLAFYSTKMNEEVYARTTKREPEIAIEGVLPTMEKLLAKFAEAL